VSPGRRNTTPRTGRVEQDVAVRFTADHQFSGPVDALAALLLDPSFHTGLQLPDVGLPEVVEAAQQGDEDVLRLRYEYTGQLDPIARRLLGNRKLTWLQEMRLDRGIGTGRLSFHAEADPGRLHGTANVRLEPTDGGAGSRRRLEGNLKVAVPVVGGTAERRIIEGLLRRLDVEAKALDLRLRDGD
jgi:hypothetical protein